MFFKAVYKLGVVVYACNLSTLEAEEEWTIEGLLSLNKQNCSKIKTKTMKTLDWHI